jgi:LuxR family maltose regulon positive regulatory protein
MILTPRESEVLALIASGNIQSEIAVMLNISGNTVNFHLDNIRVKLDAKNTVNAVAICIREKIIV